MGVAGQIYTEFVAYELEGKQHPSPNLGIGGGFGFRGKWNLGLTSRTQVGQSDGAGVAPGAADPVLRRKVHVGESFQPVGSSLQWRQGRQDVRICELENKLEEIKDGDVL